MEGTGGSGGWETALRGSGKAVIAARVLMRDGWTEVE